MDFENTFLTVEQVAEMAHLRPRTIRFKINQGLLRAYKPHRGKNWLIRRADAEGMFTGSRPSSDISRPPLIDRMGTAEGRAHAVAVLRRLGDDRDEDEQRVSGERLRQALAKSAVQMRRWDAETGERRDEAA